jgi:hypothetical protein
MFDAFVTVCSNRMDMLRQNLPTWGALSPKATLVVASWQPEDDFAAAWRGPLIVVPMEDPFSLGRGRNSGLGMCHEGWLVAVLDADMMVSLAKPDALPKHGQALFPFYHRQQRDPAVPPVPGKGWGNVLGYASTLRKANWPALIKWGGEDTAYANRLRAAGVTLVRANWPGFTHRYHTKSGEWYSNTVIRPEAKP